MENTLSQDKLFRGITSVSTGLALCFLVTSLLTIHMGDAAGLRFEWNWALVPALIAIIGWNFRFWSVVWRAQDTPTPALRTELKVHFAFLILVGMASFLYPIRFIDPARFFQVVKGLLFAAGALGMVFWFVRKFVKTFEEIDEIELRRQSQTK